MIGRGFFVLVFFGCLGVFLGFGVGVFFTQKGFSL